MIRINAIGLFCLLLFTGAVWFGRPVWVALAQLAWEYAAVRWYLAGMLSGFCLPTVIGWNSAMRYKRQSMIDRADEEYRRDKI